MYINVFQPLFEKWFKKIALGKTPLQPPRRRNADFHRQTPHNLWVVETSSYSFGIKNEMYKSYSSQFSSKYFCSRQMDLPAEKGGNIVSVLLSKPKCEQNNPGATYSVFCSAHLKISEQPFLTLKNLTIEYLNEYLSKKTLLNCEIVPLWRCVNWSCCYMLSLKNCIDQKTVHLIPRTATQVSGHLGFWVWPAACKRLGILITTKFPAGTCVGIDCWLVPGKLFLPPPGYTPLIKAINSARTKG